MSSITFSPAEVNISNLATYFVFEHDFNDIYHYLWGTFSCQSLAENYARQESVYINTESEFIVCEVDSLDAEGVSVDQLRDLEVLSIWLDGRNIIAEKK